jgi:hypothetical protein
MLNLAAILRDRISPESHNLVQFVRQIGSRILKLNVASTRYQEILGISCRPTLAIDFARRASIRRGDVARMQAQLAKTEAREALKPAWPAFHQAQDVSRLSLAVSQTIDRARSLQQQIVALGIDR